MASAYELMLVLRGRNYLSNDLRRAGSDLRRLQSQGGLESQRRQLQINAQRLATTRSIAQAELQSITTGTRRIALNKAIAQSEAAQEGRLQTIRRAEEQIERIESNRLRNAAMLSRAQRSVAGGRPLRGFNMQETRQLRDSLETQRELLASQAATASRQLELARQAYDRGALSAQELAAKEAQLSARQQVLTDRINTTTAALERNQVLLNENALAMKRLPLEQLGARARYVEHLGRSFQTLGLFATAALGVAAHSASQFDTQITLAATQATEVGNRTVRTVQANAAQISNAVQTMLNQGQTAVKPGDLTQGLYNVYSGITLQGNQREQIQQGIDIIKQFSRVYTANYGQVEFNDIVRAGIALINNFGLNAQSLPGVLNRMQASVRFGAMTMSDFVTSLNQVVPAFRGAHYGFDQMAADIAFVSRLFPSLRFGTTGLARLTEILSNRKTVQGIKEQLGLDIAPGGRLLPVDQIIREIIARRPQLARGGVGLTNFFKDVSGQQGTIQARRVFVGFATNLKLYDQIARQVTGDNQELSKSFADMSQTPQVRWAEFTNQLRGLVLEIGTHALPVFTEMAGPIKDAVRWFDNLSPSTQKLIVQFTVWGGIVAFLGGTLLVLVGALARAYINIRTFMLGRGGITAAEEGFATAGTALRLGLLGALIALLPVLLHVTRNIGGTKTAIELLITAFTTFKVSQLIAKFAAARLAAAGLATGLGLLTAAPFIITVEVVGLEIAARKIKALQEQEIAAASRTLNKRDLNKEVNLFLPDFYKLQNQGLSGAQVYQALRRRLGNSDIASQVIAALFNRANQGAFPNPAGGREDMNAKLAHARGMNQALATVQAGTTPGFDLDAAIANVEKLRRAAEKSPSYANWLAYEKALSALQARYKGDQLTALNDYLNAIESAETKSNRKRESEQEKAARKRAAAAKKAMQDAQKEVTQAAQTLQNQYQSMFHQNQAAFGQLFNGPFMQSPYMQDNLQYGHRITGHDLIKDIRSQVAQFKQWRGLLAQLRKRGITGDLYDQIVAAGPAAIDEIKALLSLNPKELRGYATTFNEGESLIQAATKQDMNLSLMRYRKYGRNIALQIIQGLRDEHTPVLKVFEEMILKDFPGLAKAAHGKGTGTTRGTVRDKTPAAATHSEPGVTKPKKPRVVRTLSSAGGTTYVDAPTYNVTSVDPHADVPTQLKHAHFVHRNRYHL